jgi:hypothetical protein
MSFRPGTFPCAGDRARSELGEPTLDPICETEGAGETAGEGRDKVFKDGIGGASLALAATATANLSGNDHDSMRIGGTHNLPRKQCTL